MTGRVLLRHLSVGDSAVCGAPSHLPTVRRFDHVTCPRCRKSSEYEWRVHEAIDRFVWKQVDEWEIEDDLAAEAAERKRALRKRELRIVRMTDAEYADYYASRRPASVEKPLAATDSQSSTSPRRADTDGQHLSPGGPQAV